MTAPTISLSADDVFSSLVPGAVAGGLPDGARERISRPDFGTWLSTVARTARGCSRPVRLSGTSTTVQPRTGEVVEHFDTATLPDSVLYKPCGSRLASVCPACSEVYRYDTYHLIKAGLSGGKGVPESVSTHPAVFVTVTAPSFGPVHTRRVKHHTCTRRQDCACRPELCRPRRDHPRCPHGRPASCAQRHGPADRRLGTPLCSDCYDYPGQLAWNLHAPKLWARTMDRLNRSLTNEAKHHGAPVKLRYAKVAELQARGAVHFHAVMRLDGDGSTDSSVIVPPPVTLTVDVLTDLIRAAVAETAIRTPPHPDNPPGWVITWGDVARGGLDLSVIRRGVSDAAITDQHVAGYLAKYATKSTEALGAATGRITSDTIDAYATPATHVGRLIGACWNLGRSDAGDSWGRLRRYAHMFGFAGHFSTKSRRYSTTLGALRAARNPTTRSGVRVVTPEEYRADDDGDDTTLVVLRHWQYAGIGWRNNADAELALAAAAAARERRPAGVSSAA